MPMNPFLGFAFLVIFVIPCYTFGLADVGIDGIVFFPL